MEYLGRFFGILLNWCNGLTGNFWWAIVAFTLLTKILLLPVSVLVQKNSIKMVKMYPEMNHIKAKYYGNKDKISIERIVSIFKEFKTAENFDNNIMKQLINRIEIGEDKTVSIIFNF